MSLFSKLFGKKTSQNEERIKAEKRGKYMPEIKLPIDEQFTINFKKNGGKFLYCETIEELKHNLKEILIENDWKNKVGLVLNDEQDTFFKHLNLKTSKQQNNNIQYFLTNCEYLISDDGSVLISSNQIAEKKLKDLPDNIILYATTSQLVGNISDGLKGIKQKSTTYIPTNITAIKHFKTTDDEDFLTYGYSSKNLYLLLLEDL